MESSSNKNAKSNNKNLESKKDYKFNKASNNATLKGESKKQNIDSKRASKLQEKENLKQKTKMQNLAQKASKQRDLRANTLDSKNVTQNPEKYSTDSKDFTKAGFIAIVGRPNAGKSTLLNAIINENIAMTSHKINATRKQMNIIVMHDKTQIIFIDTPGIHEREKLLNQFMLKETLRAIENCDLVAFLAPITDDIKHYKDFLNLSNKPHILILSKIDLVSKNEVFTKIKQYEAFKDNYKELIPLSCFKGLNLEVLLKEISKYLPNSPYLYDTELISTQNLKEICREKIREAVFKYSNKEVPYQSDVVIKSFREKETINEIYADIIVEKKSQQIILVGSGGRSIKNIGISARKSIEEFCAKKLFLKLNVVVKKGWSRSKKELKKMGYEVES